MFLHSVQHKIPFTNMKLIKIYPTLQGGPSSGNALLICLASTTMMFNCHLHGSKPWLRTYIGHIDQACCSGHTAVHNLQRHESDTIKALGEQDNTVIKPADKDRATIIWPIDERVSETSRQLNNKEHYAKCQHDPTKDYTNHITCAPHDFHSR